jgi:hypothetical protein
MAMNRKKNSEILVLLFSTFSRHNFDRDVCFTTSFRSGTALLIITGITPFFSLGSTQKLICAEQLRFGCTPS